MLLAARVAARVAAQVSSFTPVDHVPVEPGAGAAHRPNNPGPGRRAGADGPAAARPGAGPFIVASGDMGKDGTMRIRSQRSAAAADGGRHPLRVLDLFTEEL